MKKEVGFTLVELLAVIVILGILLGISVPAVIKYINGSKQSAFVANGKLLTDSIRNDMMSEIYPYPINNNDVTIITLDLATVDRGKNKSPYGGSYIYNKSYVAIVNVGTATDPTYQYYVATQDINGYAIPLTLEKEIDTSKIVMKAKNRMEVTVQSLCGTKNGYFRTYSTISGLEDVQPIDENGNRIDWNVTIFSGEECAESGQI